MFAGRPKIIVTPLCSNLIVSTVCSVVIRYARAPVTFKWPLNALGLIAADGWMNRVSFQPPGVPNPKAQATQEKLVQTNKTYWTKTCLGCYYVVYAKGRRQVKICGVDRHGERRARAYNGGLEAERPDRPPRPSPCKNSSDLYEFQERPLAKVGRTCPPQSTPWWRHCIGLRQTQDCWNFCLLKSDL